MGQKGQVTIVVLGALVILTVFVFSISHRLSVEYRISDFRLAEVKSYFLARAGLEYVFAEIDNDTSKVNSLNEPWGNRPKFYQNVPLGEGYFEVVNSADSSSLFGAVDEESKININKATKEVLSNLFSSFNDLGQAKTLAEALEKWRDEKKFFNLKEELLLMPNITEDFYKHIEKYITVYGEGYVNINTAGKEVLQSLRLGQGLIRKISDYRNGIDGLHGTIDDHIFEKIDTIEGQLSNFVAISPEERAELNRAKSNLTVQSNNFSFVSYGWLEKNKDIKKSIKVVVTKTEKGIKIREWYEE